jgi:hypothetical protein
MRRGRCQPGGGDVSSPMPRAPRDRRQPRARTQAAGLLVAALFLGTSAGGFGGRGGQESGPGPRAACADANTDLAALEIAYGAASGRADDEGYAAQRTLAEKISDLRSPDAQRALNRQLARAGAGDRRRAAILLAAIVRHGSPKDLDTVILWIETTRDPRLIDLLDRVVASALEPETRAHLRNEALPRAVPGVKAQLARALGAMGDAEAVMPLIAVLKEPNLVVRVETAGALGQLKDPRAQGPLLTMLRDPDARLREAAARALGALGRADALPHLVEALDDPVPLVVEAAAMGLSLLESPTVIAPLMARLEKANAQDLRLADALACALERISGKGFGCDVEQWRGWWAVVKDLPWQRVETQAGGGTVASVRYYGFPVRSSKVVFVLDVSRSMGWNGRLETARNELLQVLEHLPRTTRFNLVTFSDRAFVWEKSLVLASIANVQRASAYVRRQQPTNGTAAYEALQAAFGDPDADTIFFLSDGHPSTGTVVDPELILADVRTWNRFRRVKVHAVALLKGEPPLAFAGMEDSQRAEAFMRRLADENDGRFKVVK